MKPCATIWAVCSSWWELELTFRKGNHQHFLPSKNSSWTVGTDRWTPSRIGLALCWHSSFHVLACQHDCKSNCVKGASGGCGAQGLLTAQNSPSRLTTKPHLYCCVPRERVVRPGNKSWRAHLRECLQAALLFGCMSHTLKVENTLKSFSCPVTHFSVISDHLWN